MVEVVKSKRHAWGCVLIWVGGWAEGRKRCTGRCNWRRDRLQRGRGVAPSCLTCPWSGPNTMVEVVKSKRHAWGCVLIWVGGCAEEREKVYRPMQLEA